VSWLKQLLPQLRWGAGPKSKSFYDVFLARVIRIDAVQRERQFVTEPWEDVGPFFEEGRLPGHVITYRWPIGVRPEPLVVTDSFAMSDAMQRAFDAAVEAWKLFLLQLVEGRRTAVGTHALTSTRGELAAAEWRGDKLSIDIRFGDIFERGRTPDMPWRSIVILPPELPPPPSNRGKVDREDLWLCLTILHERGELPDPGPAATKWSGKFLRDRYGSAVFDERELRRYLQHARTGATERPTAWRGE
jgi:hypothetical protein